ncbi:hypothetical protein EAI_13185 [Harpegnathos saltator]|uniref:DUF4806 domain-containing protein n=2 Tax=Harpegnathos saltator TaxID=610380 RepID=E2B457_HARSA|nr:hypothetical protein EAI_13185 [Harpegnathos saltator]
MERILRSMQNNQNRRRELEKPTCLLISTEAEMLDFESANEDTYEQVVEYLEYIGGFNVKESVNLCFKEVIKDSVTTAFTWFGREEGRQRALYK